MADSLLDRPTATADDLAEAEALLTRLLGTAQDVLIVQGEAIVALEAAARGLAHPGVRALNVVTGPYGGIFGDWLTAGGAAVKTVATGFDGVVSVESIAEALRDEPDLVSIVHAEAATGGANPLDEIASLVRDSGALLVVDAVASIGAQPVTPDAWGADLVVVGPQKALAGPAGVSAAIVSDRAWAALDRNPAGPRGSYLSLLDLKHGWLDAGKRALLGTPASLESLALLEALRRVDAETLPAVIARHTAAALATRAGLRELGLRPWIEDDASAATVVTTLAVPAVPALLEKARSAGSTVLTAAPGALSSVALRIGHTGRNATLDVVLTELTALAAALGTAPALESARKAWATSGGPGHS